MVVMSGTPTKNVPVNSSSEIRNTKMALARMPGSASGRVTVRNASKADAPRLRAASSSSRFDRREGPPSRSTPRTRAPGWCGPAPPRHRSRSGRSRRRCARCSLCTATDGKACGRRKRSRNRLRQGRLPRPQSEPCRDGDGEARGHRREGDEHRVDERLHRVPLRAEHPFLRTQSPIRAEACAGSTTPPRPPTGTGWRSVRRVAKASRARISARRRAGSSETAVTPAFRPRESPGGDRSRR